MDDLNIGMLANPDRCIKKSGGGQNTQSAVSEIARLIGNIEKEGELNYLCKIIIERRCRREISTNQLKTIIHAVKNIR